MRKRYLFLMSLLFPLATMFSSGSAYAQDPDKALYDAAMAAITDGSYYLVTEVNDTKYYLTPQGELTDIYDLAAKIAVSKVSGGALYDVGILLELNTGGHFSNSTLINEQCNLHPNLDANGNPISGTRCFRLDGSNNRNDWERQVFYMNEDGKFAIRSCNTAYGTSSWADAGRAFWTYEVDEAGEPIFDDFSCPVPCYSYDPAYIWYLELPPADEVLLEVLNGIYNDYEACLYNGEEILNLGQEPYEPGQCTDWDSFEKLKVLLTTAEDLLYEVMEGYDPEDPDAITLDQVNALKAEIDSVYNKILDSEVPYMIPQNGYYRIVAHNRYKSSYDESGFVDKAIAASYDANHANKAVYSTLRKDLANFVWKLTKSESGDSIIIQNVGMGTYISFSQTSGGDRVVMTDDVNDASCVMFDYAGQDLVQLNGVDDYKDIFCIRLASGIRDHKLPPLPNGGLTYIQQGRYFHQNNHSSVNDETSPWGNYGTDTGIEQEISFWQRTWDYLDGNGNPRTTDLNTSEWYLEFVPEAEVEKLIEDFDVIMNHDVLVAKNEELRAQVLEAITAAKDPIRTALITSADQLESPDSDSQEGTNLGNLLDGDKSTFWHTDWHGEKSERMYYNDIECHYLQITGMNLVGNCEMYLCERSADNDRPSKLAILGTDNLKNEDEDWDVIADLTVPNTGSNAENWMTFTSAEAYPYIRIVVYDTAGSSYAFRLFWHAAEIQFYTIEDNPNSQFVALGEVATELERIYNENCAVADEDITPAIYQALLDAYQVFQGAMVDPTELRNAMSQYAKTTEGVVEGNEPGQWSNTDAASDFNNLYKEVDAYNKSGKYTLEQIHKYAVMLKAMSKSVQEQANGVETDKWYRIMFPTEDMYDDYGFAKDGGDNCSDLTQEDQHTMWGTFVTTAKLVSEEETGYDDDGNEVTTTYNWLEPIGGEDLRDSDRLFFMNDDAIEDKDASMFRFVELETDAADYTALLTDVKDNMSMALDMSTTYTKGEPLITEASQFSSNASYPGNDGQKLESGCLIDNNLSTYWHSDYSKTYCCVPYLQVALNKPVSGFIQVYVGRRNASNGHVVRMYVQGSNDAENWTNVGYIETPFIDVNTPVTSQPIDLGGTFSYLRFTMTNRSGSDGGSNIEFDPFAEGLTADDYNTKFTYFHASEFQVYPVTANNELSESGKALQETYTAVNKVVLKDATAEDFAAASQAYKAFQSEFNAKEGKTILPNGADKVPASYAIQNKATGLFVWVDGTGNQNNIYLKTIPTVVGYKAMGYQRSLLSAKTVAGESCNNLHAGESNRRFCTWGSTEPTSNSGLVIREADEEYAVPEAFTVYKNIKPGAINNWCSSVSYSVEGDGVAYTSVGLYSTEEGQYLALKEIESITAGEPALYIYGDTAAYESEVDDAESMKITIPAEQKLVVKGETINGLIGCLANHTLLPHEIYFSGNKAVCIGQTGYYVKGNSVVFDIESCPAISAADDYDFSIFLGGEADKADGVKDVSTAIENISKPGNVYSMDGKLLRTGATLNSLKSMGKGMYILNGVKVVVK